MFTLKKRIGSNKYKTCRLCHVFAPGFTEVDLEVEELLELDATAGGGGGG